ncbi:MAG: class I SAM-dependent methyltransferase [Chthonomonadales bacterium]
MSNSEPTSFLSVAPLYDTIMRDVPYKHWVRYLRRILHVRNLKPQSVLDLACGTGSVSCILAEDKLQVTGVDLSGAMIDVARAKAEKKKLKIRFEVQDAAKLDLDNRYDLCISFFDSLNYITDRDQLAAAFHGVFQHLNPGGLFIFDVNTEYALENSFFDQNNLDSKDRLRYIWRSEYDSATRLCTVSMRFFYREKNGIDSEVRETHLQRAYDEVEIRMLLSDAGFVDIVTYNAYSLNQVSERTDRMFVVAAKPQDLNLP